MDLFLMEFSGSLDEGGAGFSSGAIFFVVVVGLTGIFTEVLG